MKHSEDWYRGYQAGLYAQRYGERKTKLTHEEVLLIRELYATGKYSYRALSKQFPVSHMHIARIVRKEAHAMDAIQEEDNFGH